jgi:hypothetical protein
MEEGVSHPLDYIVRCGDERIAIRIDLKDARIDAHKASLGKASMSQLVVIERASRIVERWQNGERVKP